MDARTLEALKASIAKWEKNAVAKRPEVALVMGDSCPLCATFCNSEDATCDGCPVFEKTGRHGCDGSPWFKAMIARSKWARGEHGADAFHAAARAEVSFLKSLLPSDEAAS